MSRVTQSTKPRDAQDLGAAAGLHERLHIACRGLSVREVADITGLNHETVRRYLNGTVPSISFVANLAIALAISSDWLLLGLGPIYRVEMIDHALREAGPERLFQAVGKLVERAYQHAVHDDDPGAPKPAPSLEPRHTPAVSDATAVRPPETPPMRNRRRMGCDPSGF
jgi:transcriptional regulator with XRE-family HTH domain